MSHKCPTFTSLLLCTSVLPPHESFARRKSLSSAVNELSLCSATFVDPTSFSLSSVFLIRIHRLADVSCSCTVVSPTLPLSRRSLTLSLTRSTSSNMVLFLYFLDRILSREPHLHKSSLLSHFCLSQNSSGTTSSLHLPCWLKL